MSKAKQSKKLKCVGWAVVYKRFYGYGLCSRIRWTKLEALDEFNSRCVTSLTDLRHKHFRVKRVYVEEWE